MVIIMNDDPTFLWWRENNPTGFIVVSHNPPSGNYLTLHKVDGCSSVKGNPSNGENWTVNQSKICSREREEIEAWAKRSFDATVHECGHCFRK